MKLKIALLQISSHGNDQKKNLEKGEQYCRQAKEAGVDIILFPEMWNIGYEYFDEAAFDQSFDPLNISDDLTDKIKTWNTNAISIDSDFVNHFIQLSGELDVAIALTFLQKGKDKPFNSVILIDKHGNIVLNYSKVHTCDFSMEYFCEPGDKFFVCDLDTRKGNIKVGAMICFDREFPESARELMLQGAEIILIPNCCDMDSHRTAQLKTRAFENMVGVALTNYPEPKCNGKSQAYSPLAYNKEGKELNNLITMADEKEGIYTAEFDMDEIREYRNREVWGNAYRKVNAYSLINSTEVRDPFTRKNSGNK
ncbi:MAG: carbon-nitrogen hydrolase family protein [Ignavibacteria bacterium]|nr:carbon-nitrogen hydrolase family protein [Ignavibacteria bacterium]